MYKLLYSSLWVTHSMCSLPVYVWKSNIKYGDLGVIEILKHLIIEVCISSVIIEISKVCIIK